MNVNRNFLPSLPVELTLTGGRIAFDVNGIPRIYDDGFIYYDETLDKSALISYCQKHRLSYEHTQLQEVPSSFFNRLTIVIRP
jgi:hypothetical protein